MKVTWTGNKIEDNNNDNDGNKSNNDTQKMKVKKNTNYEANTIKGAIDELGRNAYCYGRR